MAHPFAASEKDLSIRGITVTPYSTKTPDYRKQHLSRPHLLHSRCRPTRQSKMSSERYVIFILSGPSFRCIDADCGTRLLLGKHFMKAFIFFVEKATQFSESL